MMSLFKRPLSAVPADSFKSPLWKRGFRGRLLTSISPPSPYPLPIGERTKVRGKIVSKLNAFVLF
jgi:hypothetical protein